MDSTKAIITVRILKKKIEEDLEVPLGITVNELAAALNEAYELGLDTDDMVNCYLKAENPIVLMKGNHTLEEFGIRNGSLIILND